MAEIKKISTELQPLDKLLDTSGDAGTSGQILTSTGTGTNWVAAGTPGTGVYLPLVGGTLSGPGNLTVSGTTNLLSTLTVAGVTTLANTGYLGDGLGSVQYTLQSANDGFGTIDFGDVADVNIGRLSYSHVDDSFSIRTNNATALTLDSSQNATFAGDVTIAANLYATGQNLKFHAAGTHVMNIDVNGKVYPNVTNAYDLGHSANLAWRDLYLSGSITSGGGGTFAGLVSGIAPTSDLNFATKKYVDDSITGGANYLGSLGS
jgi:hypothetical protein